MQDWPFSKYIVVNSLDFSATGRIPEYFLVLNSAPQSSDDFLVPFISRLLDYRWRFNEFLQFHFLSSTNQSGLLDFLSSVKFHINYKFIEERISGDLHEVASEEGVEEYLEEIRNTISEFIDQFRSQTSFKFKLNKNRAIELTVNIFILSRLIPLEHKSFLVEVMATGGSSQGRIKFKGSRVMLVAFFRILHKEGLLDKRYKDASFFIADNFENETGKPYVRESLRNALNPNDKNFWSLEKLKEELALMAKGDLTIISNLDEIFFSITD